MTFRYICNMENELNDYGLLVFKHKTNKNIFLQRSFKWIDRITMIDEAEGRQIIDTFKFSEFDLSSWEAVTREEYSKAKKSFKEMYS